MSRATGVALALVLLLLAAVYAIALPGPFQFDDHATVAVDPGARSVEAWWADARHHVRPLTKLTFALSYSLGEWLDHVPAGHRLANLAIHLLAVAAFFLLGQAVVRTCVPDFDAGSAPAAALAAAALFGLHPLGTEAVSYLCGRSMSLGTLLAATSLWTFIRWRTEGGHAWFAAAVLTGTGAAFARETAAVVPLLWLAWEMARQSPAAAPFSAGRLRAVLRGSLVPSLMLVAFGVWLIVHQRYAPLLEVSRQIAAHRIGEPTFALATQYFASSLVLLHYPTIDPDVSAAAMSPGAGLLIVFVLAALAAAAWRVRRTASYVLFGLLWGIAWLAPLYAVPVRYDVLAERHFYPAIWGFMFTLCAVAVRWTGVNRPRRAVVAAAAVAAGLALSIVTLARNTDYRSEIALWEAARRSAPTKVRVLNNLGVAYMEAARWDDARAVLARAVALRPGDVLAEDNLLAAEQRELGPVRWPRRTD